MNKCKICGDTCPDGKDLCWVCEHTPKFEATEECEMCKIPEVKKDDN